MSPESDPERPNIEVGHARERRDVADGDDVRRVEAVRQRASLAGAGHFDEFGGISPRGERDRA